MATYDRFAEIKAFDETKAGVKGLVDAGITSIPRIFHAKKITKSDSTVTDIPIIDMQGEHERVVEEVKKASEMFGFFQVVNHGVPQELLDEMEEGVRRFNEQKTEVKMKYYGRDLTKKVLFNSNFDLYESLAANWRDTLSCIMRPEPPSPEELPLACREVVIEYTEHIQKLGIKIFELLSEALGLNPNYLNEIECAKGLTQAIHYYPPCPQPDLTLGATEHTDPGFITILLQDHIGGLQIRHQNQWIDCHPVPGALVINIADLLQLITNDNFKSVEHRVLANNQPSPRISIASFFFTQFSDSSRLYGPIKELASPENPPKYRETLMKDYSEIFFKKGLDGRTAIDYLRF